MDRRQFLRLASASAAMGLPAAAQTRDKRPNILVILADDLGFSDVGCYGSEIETPNLDRLARTGICFTQFYNTARCCPTRASLLTGLYPHQAGVGHMVQDRGLPAYRGRLNDRCSTIAEVLKPAGYRTLMAGKWHVGETRPHWPTDRGFEKYFGLVSGASNYWRVDPGRGMALDSEPYTPTDKNFYMTDAFTDHAVKFIGEYGRGPQPFFMYLAYTAPHWPLHAPEDVVAKYEGKYMKGWDALRRERHAAMIEMGLVDKRWPITPRDPEVPAWEDVKDKKSYDRSMAVYAAQIDRMDQGIGRVMAKLREVGAEDNTLVLFLADNGGCAEIIDRGVKGVPPGPADSYLSYGPPWANASNTPFRLYKHWVHEGGIATPLIAHWPAAIRERNSITHQPGHLIDIMSTCVDLGQAKYNAKTPMEGKSLRPVLEGKRRQPHDSIFWEHEGNRAVRQDKWKLVGRHQRDWELYDLEADRTEMKNLAKEHADRAAKMASDYDVWAKRCHVEPFEDVRSRKAV